MSQLLYYTYHSNSKLHYWIAGIFLHLCVNFARLFRYFYNYSNDHNNQTVIKISIQILWINIFFQHLCINASIFTLVIIALDRYRGIIWPLKGGYSKFRAKLIVVCVWVVAVTPATPNLVVFHVSWIKLNWIYRFRSKTFMLLFWHRCPIFQLQFTGDNKWSRDGNLYA